MPISGNWDVQISRRHFVGLGGAGAMALVFRGTTLSPRATGASRFAFDPFSLGVASGDPTADGVVLWTRLAPEPLAGGGMPDRAVPVRWEVAEDSGWRRVVARGEELARPELGHSVHVEVNGLRPGREYFYRFKAGADLSPTGRTKTAPAKTARTPMRFAFASCQHLEHGFYTSYRHMADEDLDLVVHLGDYIYEFAPRAYLAPSGVARDYRTPEPTTLDGYRARHAEHRSDADLQAAHRAFPWVVTWDDHEVEDNYAGSTCGSQDPQVFLRRRRAAYQAYYEHMPLRRRARPRPHGMRLHRRIHYGSLVQLNVLDTRQYRDNQVAAGSAAQRAPGRTVLGSAQERWLFHGLHRSTATWNVLAQQILFSPRRVEPGERPAVSDSWDGYPVARRRVTAALARASNSIVLSGDVHASWANELVEERAGGRPKPVGAEFVGTSISSGGDGADGRDDLGEILAANPHIRFFNGQRGYVRCRVSAERWQTDYRVVPFVRRPGAPISTRASFSVAAGDPRLERIAPDDHDRHR